MEVRVRGAGKPYLAPPVKITSVPGVERCELRQCLLGDAKLQISVVWRPLLWLWRLLKMRRQSVQRGHSSLERN